MRDFLVIAILIGACASPVSAQQLAPPQRSITYTLTQDQVNTLYAAMVAADFWLKVRGESAPGTLDARGYELQRKELQTLSVEMGRQAQSGAKGDNPAPSPSPSPAPAKESTP